MENTQWWSPCWDESAWYSYFMLDLCQVGNENEHEDIAKFQILSYSANRAMVGLREVVESKMAAISSG